MINNSQGYVWKAIEKQELEEGLRLEVMEGEKLECILRIVAVIIEEGSDAQRGS